MIHNLITNNETKHLNTQNSGVCIEFHARIVMHYVQGTLVGILLFGSRNISTVQIQH